MKKLFAEYPLVGIFITSCFTCLTLVIIALFGVFLIGKGVAKTLGDLTKEEITTTDSKYTHIDGNSESKNKILVIPVGGIILTEKPQDSFFSLFDYGYTYGYEIKNLIAHAAQDESIKAIILHIDSPGGTITGAKAISDGVEYYKKVTNKPVIAYTSGLAASGGYWVASGADKIVADSGTLVGSIGVIMGPFKQYNKVLGEGDIITEKGIDSFYFTAGENKDLGNPFKTMPEEAKKKLQNEIDNEYAKFVEHVSSTRNINKDVIVKDIGAMVFGVEKALELSLIDYEGTKQFSYTLAGKEAGLESTDFEIIGYKYNDFWSKLVNSQTKVQKPQTCVLCNKMLYLYENPEKY